MQASFNEGMLGGFLDAFDDLTYGVFAESEAGPAMARGAGKVVIKQAAKVRKATTGFGAWLTKGPKDVNVYKFKKDGKWHVGITNDLERRKLEHGGVRLKPIHEGLTRNQARAIENRLIKENRSRLSNKIQSVSDRHRYSGKADVWAKGFMEHNNIPITLH